LREPIGPKIGRLLHVIIDADEAVLQPHGGVFSKLVLFDNLASMR
jgi:hypothetical protein